MNVLSPSSLSKGERVSFPSRRPRAANRVRRRTQSLGLYLYLLGYASAAHSHDARHGEPAGSGERSKQPRTRSARRDPIRRAGQGKSNRTEQSRLRPRAVRRAYPPWHWQRAVVPGPFGRRPRTRMKSERNYEGQCTATCWYVYPWGAWRACSSPASCSHGSSAALTYVSDLRLRATTNNPAASKSTRGFDLFSTCVVAGG